MSEKRVPKLRFKGFSGDWEQRKLGALGSVVMNKRIFKEQTSDDGDVPFYKIGTFGSEPDAYISYELFEEYKEKYPYPEIGDILLSASGSIGRSVVYEGKDEYFQDSNIIWLKHDERLDNKFLKQFYLIVKWQGLEGSTIKRLYNKNILDTNIFLPSPTEQGKIGCFFEKLDNIIALHQRKLELIKQLKQGFLQQMFVRDGENEPVLRFADFGSGWEQHKLGELGEITTGYPFSSKDFDSDGEYLVITNKDISDSSRTQNTITDRVNIYDDKLISKYNLDGNNILITMDGVNIGKVAVYSNNRALLAQRVGRIQSDQLEFIYQVTANSVFLSTMRTLSVGNAIKHISLKHISDYSSFVPINKEEQKKIGTFFKQLDNTIALYHNKLEQLQSLKKGYLNALFI